MQLEVGKIYEGKVTGITKFGAFVELEPGTTGMLISKCYPPEQAGTATGLVIGSATLFDIAFNALFGRFTEAVGLANSILILPAAMLIYCIVYLELHRYLKNVGE